MLPLRPQGDGAGWGGDGGVQRFLSEQTRTLKTTTILGSPAYMAPEQMQVAGTISPKILASST